MASFKHNDDANDDDDDDGNDSTKIFFNHLESQNFFKYLCEEDFDLITFCDKNKDGLKQLESMLTFCILHVYKSKEELLHSSYTLKSLDKNVENEIEKLKVQCEILEKLSRTLSDDEVVLNLSSDNCFGMILDMVIENLYTYKQYNEKLKSMLKLKNNKYEYIDCAAISVFDVDFLDTADGLMINNNNNNNRDDYDNNTYSQKIKNENNNIVDDIDEIFIRVKKTTNNNMLSSSSKYTEENYIKNENTKLIMSVTNDIIAYVFDIFSVVLNCDKTTVVPELEPNKRKIRRSIVNKRINSNFISFLVNQLMTSSHNNPLERELCKYSLMDLIGRRSVRQIFFSILNNSILECISCKINVENFTLRNDSNQIFMIENTNCSYVTMESIREILTILNMFIAKAFHTPLWRYERHMIFNTLLPLHKTTYLPVIIDLVTNCIEEIINIEPSILERYVHILLYKIWPTRSSVKQVCLQHELKTLVKLSDKYNNTDILKLIYHKISKLISSQHFQVALEYTSFFEIVEFIEIFEKHKENLVPIISEALEENVNKHWHRGVRLRSKELLNAIDIMWKEDKSKKKKKNKKKKKEKPDKSHLKLDTLDNTDEDTNSSDDSRRRRIIIEAFSPKHNRKSSETRVYSPVRRNAGKGFFQIFHKKVPVVPSMNDRMDLYVIDTSSDDGDDDDDDTNNLTSDWLKKRSNNIINKK